MCSCTLSSMAHRGTGAQQGQPAHLWLLGTQRQETGPTQSRSPAEVAERQTWLQGRRRFSKR